MIKDYKLFCESLKNIPFAFIAETLNNPKLRVEIGDYVVEKNTIDKNYKTIYLVDDITDLDEKTK